MQSCFYVNLTFNQPLNSWNVSGVTTMFDMFAGARDFNQPLNSWNVSNVTNMGGMFRGIVGPM
jgi:surface protein